jgi:hypothetical protein
VIFRLLPRGFANRDLREHLAPLLGVAPSALTQGQMTYDLRRLRLHGLIERIAGTHRYQLTDFGLASALLPTRTYTRVLRPGLAELLGPDPPASSPCEAPSTSCWPPWTSTPGRLTLPPEPLPSRASGLT